MGSCGPDSPRDSEGPGGELLWTVVSRVIHEEAKVISRPRHDGLDGNRGIDPVIHNLGTRWVRIAKFTPTCLPV